MNDSSRFGMAKSFVTMAQSNGFDVNNPEDMNEFINVYNQNILDKNNNSLSVDDTSTGFEQYIPGNNTQSRKIKAKKRKARKSSKASRQKNKKKHKR